MLRGHMHARLALCQGPARLFPELERDQRSRVDFGLALDMNSGEMGYRGEGTGPAVDGQAGRIISAYREHTMAPDSSFLKKTWPGIKKATEFMLNHDTNKDGVLDGPQENTLDAAWFGQIPWTSTLFIASLEAAAVMASEMGDEDFAKQCRDRVAAGKASMESRLWNGEYFVQLPEKGHESNLGSYSGCHIDQIMGEAWLQQVGLPPILDRAKTRTALKSLYKYNFTPNVGPFRAVNKEGRPYALAGDGGLIMVSNPLNLKKPYGDVSAWQFGYFNECMSGFEHSTAAHMISEGLVQEGLAVVRAIHDRYHASKRNPFNEIECSDHYSRSMASYGAFVAACGFVHHGPKGHLGFAPKIGAEKFKAPFVTAEGWGGYSQALSGGVFEASVEVKHGRLRVNTLSFEHSGGSVDVSYKGKKLAASLESLDGRVTVRLEKELVVPEGGKLLVRVS